MIFKGTEEYDLSRLLDLYKNDLLGRLIISQVSYNLKAQEESFIERETKALIEENAALGGSPLGYLFRGEAFFLEPVFKQKGVLPIDSSLEESAGFLKSNRDNIPQCIVYFSNMMTALKRTAKNLGEYVANVPDGFQRLSPSLALLRAEINKQTDGVDTYKFDPSEPGREAFFGHLARLQPSLNRFLYRGIMK